MKRVFLISLLAIVFSACKMEVQKKSETTISANTQLSESQITLHLDASNSEEVLRLKEEIEEKQARSPEQIFEVIPVRQSTGEILVSGLKDNHLYKSKNFYIFIGLGNSNKDEAIQKTDWDALYAIMNYLAKKSFRVMINVQATAEHLRLASEDSETSIILWSSHGNKKAFYDYNGEPVPYDIFKNRSKNFYQFILSSCEGRIALDDNYNYGGLITYAWPGLTNSSELRSFLVSDKWSADIGNTLVTPKNDITCTVAKNGKGYALMKSSNRRFLYGDTFEKLESCKSSLAAIKNGTICSRGDEGVKKVNVGTLSVSNESYSSLEECSGQ